MKKLICTVMAIVGICSMAMSQERWYVAPSATVSAVGDNAGYAAGLTLGRYITKADNLRIDLQGNYLVMTEGSDFMTASAMVMTETKIDIFGWNRLFSSLGFGVGVLTPAGQSNMVEEQHTDVIIPFKGVIEYRFAEHISCGMDISYSLNAGRPKTLGPANLGVFLGFRF